MIPKQKILQKYGKGRVRFLRIWRPANDIPTKSTHYIEEYMCQTLISGNFDAVYDGTVTLTYYF